MQSLPTTSSSVSNRSSKHGSDLLGKRRTVYADPSSYEQPPSPSRIVVAEGSEFVLQRVRSRGSPSSSSSSSAARHVTIPPSTAVASSPSRSHTQARTVSTSVTPPRIRQADRPYRPPPSSSARFYERQQQLWLLQQPSLSPPSDSEYIVSNPKQPHASRSSRFNAEQPGSAPDLLQLRASSATHTSLANDVYASSTTQSGAALESSASARSRAPSVSSLAPPAAHETGNRARSGSDTGSFTRSRISSGYQSHTDDDDSVDYDAIRKISAVRPWQAELQSSAGGAAFIRTSTQWRATEHELAQPRTALGASTLHRSSEALDGLEDSVDANWDAELGISEADHAEPLRLPVVRPGDLVSHASSTVIGDAIAAKPSGISNQLIVSSVPARIHTESHLRSPHAADLKGIRIMSSVTESWDDDFLFQTEEAPITTPRQGSPDSLRTAVSERNQTRLPSSSRQLHHQSREDDDDDDVENWDDAFSWNADPHLTPSASNTSSLHNSVRVSYEGEDSYRNTNVATGDCRPTRKLLPDVRRHLDFGSTAGSGGSKKRLSNASSASDATEFSARLAAQSDADSYRLSRNSGDFNSSDQLPASSQRNLTDRHKVGRHSDASGDDTETDTPLKAATAPGKDRSGRRSLGAALGFDTSRNAVADGFTTRTRSSSHVVERKNVELDSAAAKTHTRSQSRSKLGALQRLSFSRSRVSVANASSTSVNKVPETDDTPVKMYSDNRSQASLLSQVSTSSNRSRRAASPTSLKKSYAALRSTSFRRLLGRSVQNSVQAPSEGRLPRTPPTSPPRCRSELTGSPDAMSSPPSENVTTMSPSRSMSPPTAWLGFRRSSEVTPTRPEDQSNRRGGDTLHRGLSSHGSYVNNGSPVQSLSFLSGSTHGNDAVLSAGSTHNEAGWRDGTTAGVGNQPKRPDLPLTAGLRREPSSSNTLRTTHRYGAEVRPAPSKVVRDGSGGGKSMRQLQPAHRKSQTRIRSDEASADDSSTASIYPYLGEKMLRASDDRGSASRSVSASTAYSRTSNESFYGYRMRKETSVSSGHDAHDSETSYGTSVGSSPGMSNPSSSGWLFHSKRGAAPSTDTRDTVWTASVDLPGRCGTPSKADDCHSRTASLPGSPLHLETTLDGAPAKTLQDPRKQPVPAASLSPSHHTAPRKSESVLSSSPATPSKHAHHITEPTRSKRGSSAVDTSASKARPSSSASSHKRATRRNSLSDLKIPSRISKAQDGLRNNINLVRDFAKGIEELKSLKASYMHHKVRAPLSSSDVEDRVQNWLECADVLIGLGEGRSESDTAARVDTVSHTPLFTRVDSRRTAFSDVSSYSSPRSPLEDTFARKPSVSAARSVSGTSQSTTSTTDGGRSVDVQREIDILSEILGGTTVNSVSQYESRPHGRFQSDSYTQHEHPYRNNSFAAMPPTPVAVDNSNGGKVGWSNFATSERRSVDDKRSEAGSRTLDSERPFNAAPIINGASSGLTVATPYDEIDVGDANRSAKRRLRSASRAGLQGLRELLKVFKGAAGAESALSSSKAVGIFQSVSTGMSVDEARDSIDGGPLTPPASKQKRKSLNLKRRSFLRSKASLESMQAKNTDGTSGSREETTHPPVAGTAERYSLAMRKSEQRKRDSSPSKVSLDATLDIRAADHSLDAKDTAKAIQRNGFYSALGSAKRLSVDTSAQTSMLQSTDTKASKRPSLAVRPQKTTADTNVRCASTSVDSMHHRLIEMGKPRVSIESPPILQASTVPKLTLRPEAMPGLLVYVQATKQHLQAAIEDLAPPIEAGYKRA